MEYHIKEDKKEVEGCNEFDSIIEITGVTSEITINGLLDHLEMTKRVLKEQTAQMELNDKLIGTAEEELPVLKDIPKDKIGLALSWAGKHSANKQAVELIATCEETISVYENHLRNIEEQTGIKCVPEVSPFQPNITIEHKTQNG